MKRENQKIFFDEMWKGDTGKSQRNAASRCDKIGPIAAAASSFVQTDIN